MGESANPSEVESASDPLADLAAAKDQAITPDRPSRRADIESRFMATFLDLLAWILIAALCDAGIRIFEKLTSLHHSISEPFRWLAIAIAWLLYTLLEVFGAGTPGKRLIGIHIGTIDGQVATMQRKCFRWLLRRLPDLAAALVAALAFWAQNRSRPPAFIESIFLLSLLAMGLIIYFDFFAFICCLGYQKLALYDRWTKTSVIGDLDETDPPKAGFRVVLPSSTSEGERHQ